MCNYRVYYHGIRYGLKAFLPVVMAAFFVLQCLPSAMAADAKQTSGKEDLTALSGRWARPDGGYVLDLREIGKDGSLKALYYNPNPINVSRAEIRRRSGKIMVFIELRDVNYPGSKYDLKYDSATDRLVGTYFQAVENMTYKIEFLRDK